MYKKIYKSMRMLALITLLMATVMTYFAASGMFTSRIKEEVASETQLLATLLQEGDAVAMLQSVKTADKRITLIAADGSVLYDNAADIDMLGSHADRPEVIEALESGSGARTRYSVTQGKSLYYCAQRLDDGSVLRVACVSTDLYTTVFWLLVPTAFIALLVYIISLALSLNLSDKIIAPVEKIDPYDTNYDDLYPELVPLMRRISAQNREIKRQAARVERQNLRFRAIGEQMTDGLVLLGRSKKIIMVNAAALDAFGANETDVLGQNFLHLCRDVELCDNLEKAWEGHRFQTEKLLCGKYYQLYCSPILQEGSVTGVLLMLFDISEKREAEQIRREFTANVSHELKTPLTTVLGYAQLVNNNIAKAEDVPSFTAKIEKEATRLLTLIDDIIELSKLDEMQEAPQKTTLSLEAIALEVIDSLADKAATRGIQMTLVGEDTQVEGNLRQITELVYNLCDNAIKYNKENGSVRIALSDKTLAVSDTGVGIAPQYTERIFERFFRVDKSHSKTVNGTGLGLSIVKHIAMCHNAQISVESKPGEGTCFTVKFEK